MIARDIIQRVRTVGNLSIETLSNVDATYAEVVAIRRQVFVEEQGVPADLEIDQYEDSCHFFLARIKGHSVGCGRLRQNGAIIKFERIATLASCRGKGVGRALLGAMEQYCSSKYPTVLPYMHAQLTASNFYKRLGWLQTNRGTFLEAGIAHEELIRPLPGEETADNRVAPQDTRRSLDFWIERYRKKGTGGHSSIKDQT